MFPIAIVAVVTVVVLGALLVALRAGRIPQIANDEAAFEGTTELGSLTDQRVAEIQPYVDRVALIVRRRTIRDILVLEYDIFLMDTNGSVHNVAVVGDRDEAARTATELARRFEVSVEDPEGLLE